MKAELEETKEQLFQFKHCTIISNWSGMDVINYALFQFKHCTIISRKRNRGYLYEDTFQFKHCTIIRKINSKWSSSSRMISIQALYDYKTGLLPTWNRFRIFQFKHCTIISLQQRTVRNCSHRFQFKHCTIISKLQQLIQAMLCNFNSSIVRL